MITLAILVALAALNYVAFADSFGEGPCTHLAITDDQGTTHEQGEIQ